MAYCSRFAARVLFAASLMACVCTSSVSHAQATSSTEKSTTSPADTKKEATWLEELTDVAIPKTKATGKIHGNAFTIQRAEIQQGTLTMRQGSGFFADLEWKLFLFAPEISRLEGHFLNIDTEDTEAVKNMPHVYMSWKEGGKDLPKTKTWTGGYVIQLRFGHVTNGKLPGEIYLCVPDMKRSFVAGTFEATIK